MKKKHNLKIAERREKLSKYEQKELLIGEEKKTKRNVYVIYLSILKLTKQKNVSKL